MKARLGFVSNSSSSSFVVLKSTLTEAEISDFRYWVDNVHNRNSGEGYIYESPSTFFGEKDYHVELPPSLSQIHTKFEYS